MARITAPMRRERFSMSLLRYVLPVVMLAHGLAHLPGFVTAWRLRTLPDFPYHTLVLRGRWDVGDAGMRVLGVLWLAAALGLWVAALGVFTSDARWIPLAFATVVLSAMLCVLEWPIARVGLWTNLVLLGLLLLAA